MRTMNIAARYKYHYESDDFKESYQSCLLELYANNEGDIINRIQNIIDHEYYFEKKYGFNKYLSKEIIKIIYDYIIDNFDDFVTGFNGYYVGDTSLESVSFGEQEEQLTGIHNHKTGKDYNIHYLKRVFDKEGYYVKNNYAYYDLNSGLHVDLLHADIPKKLFV